LPPWLEAFGEFAIFAARSFGHALVLDRLVLLLILNCHVRSSVRPIPSSGWKVARRCPDVDLSDLLADDQVGRVGVV
jgi:hypothetical protein